MPFYKLICSRCGEAFEKLATISQRTEKAIACPACGSTDVETDFTAGSPGVLKKAADGETCPHSGGCCCGCHGKH